LPFISEGTTWAFLHFGQTRFKFLIELNIDARKYGFMMDSPYNTKWSLISALNRRRILAPHTGRAVDSAMDPTTTIISVPFAAAESSRGHGAMRLTVAAISLFPGIRDTAPAIRHRLEPAGILDFEPPLFYTRFL